MKIIIIAVVSIVLLIGCASTRIIENSKESRNQYAMMLANYVLEKDSFNELINNTINQQIEYNSELAPYKEVMLAFFDKYLNVDSLRPSVAELYASYFTADELYQLCKFYETSVGKKSVRLQSEIFMKAQKIGYDRAMEHQDEFISMINNAMKKNEME